MSNLDVRVENGRQIAERWDRVFEALSAEPRRQLVASLLDAAPDSDVPLPESAINPDVPTDPERLRHELHHRHLPMLAEQDVIEWETEPLVATRGPRFDEVAAVMEALHEAATDVPDSLVIGCRRLERERQKQFGESTSLD